MELQLIENAKAGDNNAVEEIVSRYKGLVRSIANKFFLAGGDKDDLLQEGMLGLFKAIHDFDQSKGAFASFAKLCVYRQILNSVKSDNSQRNLPLKKYIEISTLQNIVLPQDSPLDYVVSSERADVIQNIIETKLSKTEKAVLVMFLDGFGYDEMSKKLEKSYKAVDGALQRARKKLLSCVENEED